MQNPIRPLLITTSDVRAPKVHQLCSHPDTKGPTAEVAWYLAPARAQFRISARTYILSSPSHNLHSQFPTKLLSSPGSRNAGPDSPETSEEWEKFRLKTFNSLPAFLRASFVRPTPGSLLSNPNDAYKWPTTLPESGKEESEEDRRNMKEALKNFAVIVLEPLEVEFLEFAIEPNRRTQWKISGSEWKERSIVP
jgi:pyridoxamine 5'-phosphate oxidase